MNKVLIVGSVLNNDISDILSASARAVLEQNGIDYEQIKVEGIFEIPAAVSIALDSFDYDGVIVLGSQISQKNMMENVFFKECARGMNDISIHFSIPVGFGVFIADDHDSAIKIAHSLGKKSASVCMELMKIKSLYQTFYNDSSSGYKN